ncbi:MAG: ribonuclease III [Prevotella sp.]|nr:ribonuclease III [Prevotella sp.]
MRLKDIIERIKLPFRKDKELFSALYDIMGFYPHQIEHYKVALTHKSIRQLNDKGKPLNNERLEFLGDAMLDAVVGHIVYSHFSNKREGFLTNTRSKLVSRDTLGKLAQEMGLTALIQSSGEQRSHNSYMAGNAFEALVGAIYLDQGYDAVMRFMEKRILKQMVNIDKVAYKEVNFKSKLLEWTQKNRVRLDYQMLKQKVDEKGSPVFGFLVIIEGVEGEKGQGYSKKEAQQLASQATLERLRREPQFIDAIFTAKSNRTKMEEEPTTAAPDLEAEKNEFIIEQEKGVQTQMEVLQESEKKKEPLQQMEVLRKAEQPKEKQRKERKKPAKPRLEEKDEFDLSDITHNPVDTSREDIIAAAEEAAFSQ